MESGHVERHNPVQTLLYTLVVLLGLCFGCAIMFNLTIDRLTLPRTIESTTAAGQTVVSTQAPLLGPAVFGMVMGQGAFGAIIVAGLLLLSAAIYARSHRPAPGYAPKHIVDMERREDPYRTVADVRAKTAQAQLREVQTQALVDELRGRKEWAGSGGGSTNGHVQAPAGAAGEWD